jgi:GH25 family lysozyme M1 (1,4-beta-N-acetylmuramidase)
MRRFAGLLLSVVCMLLVALRAEAAVDIKGIDVSHYQGTINWALVAGGGYKFAFMKATEGTTYIDPTFTTNRTNANAAGVMIGFYDFCHVSTTASDGVTEANHFLASIKPVYLTGQYLPPVADVESFPTGLTTAQLKTATSNWVQTFSDTIYNSLGVRPIIYTSKSKATSYYTTAVENSHELWEAWWKGTGTTSPPVASDTPGWGIWQFWQWSDGADAVALADPVPGISGHVDRDVYYGTLDQLKALRIGKDNSKPGDFNRDGVVNSADYNVWFSNNGKTVPLYTGADGNGDAKVNSADYAIWVAAGAPEPGSSILVSIGMCFTALGSGHGRWAGRRNRTALA